MLDKKDICPDCSVLLKSDNTCPICTVMPEGDKITIIESPYIDKPLSNIVVDCIYGPAIIDNTKEF